MNTLRLILAVTWTAAWGAARYLIAIAEWQNGQRLPRWRDAFMWGRSHSPKAVRCSVCGWTGPLRWLRHWYVALAPDDVEAADFCPRPGCGAQDSHYPIRWGNKQGWAS